MKAYVVTTSVIFGLITGAHFLRLYYEPYLATDVAYLLITALAGGICAWGIGLLVWKTS